MTHIKSFDVIADELGIESNFEVAEKKKLELIEQNEEENIQLAAQTLKDVLSQADDATETLKVLAEVSESPRVYEVLATMMKTRIDAAKELVNLRKNQKSGGQQSAGVIINNNGANTSDTLGLSVNDILRSLQNANTQNGKVY